MLAVTEEVGLAEDGCAAAEPERACVAAVVGVGPVRPCEAAVVDALVRAGAAAVAGVLAAPP